MATVSAWNEDRVRLLAAATELGVHERDAVRIADLLLARSLAGHLGLVDQLLNASRLGIHLEEVTLFPLPKLLKGRARREAAVSAATACASHMSKEDLFHVWSEDSQARDPGRKGRGAFSTPPPLAAVIAKKGIGQLDASRGGLPNAIDPSAGHGALLLALLDAMIASGTPVREAINCLHGVELDPHARELCCLTLWLKAAHHSIGFHEIASRVVLGNALTANWMAEQGSSTLFATSAIPNSDHDLTFTWETTFPKVFDAGGFDLVVANPPWESLRHFHSADPEDWIQREATRSRLATPTDTGRELPLLYSAQGRGDKNLYKGFTELFPHLLAQEGCVVALLPGAFSSDFGMQDIRQRYLDHMALERWTSFENLEGYFPIDGRYKFGILVAVRNKTGTRNFEARFMARDAKEAASSNGHLVLSPHHITKLGGPSKMFPEVSNRYELGILERAFDHGSGFFDPDGSFGPVAYRRELDLTTDRKAGRFVHVRQAQREGFRPLRTGAWSNGSRALVPLIEGRMISSWDFFEKSWISGRGRTSRWRINDAPLSFCQPQFLAPGVETNECRLAICDVTSATNTRTMRATWVPSWPCGNTAPVLIAASRVQGLSLLAVLNSMTFDWLLRRLAAGLHLNRFYLEAVPVPRVSSADSTKLATFAATSMLKSRCRGLARREVAGLKHLAAAVPIPTAGEVEAIVAGGYGLEADDMRRVMDTSTEDRKGLWRFFAANPDAIGVAEEGINRLAAA